MKTTTSKHQQWFTLLIFLGLALLSPHFAFAADMFATGKTTISDTLSDTSTVHYALMATAALVGILVGILQKNWPMGIAVFFVANIFWSVAMTIIK